MIRYLLRWMLILSGLFTLPVLLIRAQPYDDSELRAFLTPPEGCPAPCFMGIRPGVTTVDEAIAILENHEWALEVVYVENERRIYWRWAEQSPDFHGPATNYLELAEDNVSKVVLSIKLKIGDIIATFGSPDWGRIDIRGPQGIVYSFGYEPEFPAYSSFMPSVKWFGKLHYVLNRDPIIRYEIGSMENILVNPSLANFMLEAEENS